MPRGVLLPRSGDAPDVSVGRGLKAENIYGYFTENRHTDFEHAETGAPLLKAQRPEFEMWSQGLHARSGVACAACHMPYQRVGAVKISDHHVRSRC